MPITVVSSGGAATQNGSAVTLNFTAIKGDLVLVMGGTNFRTGITAGTSSDGWTVGAVSAVDDPTVAIMYKVMGDTPDTSIVCLASGNSNDSSAYVYYVLRGVDTTNIKDEAWGSFDNGNSTNPNNTASYPTTVGALIVNFASSMVYDTSPGTVADFGNDVSATQTDTFGFTTAACTKIANASDVASGKNPGAWSSWSTGLWRGLCFSIKPYVPKNNVLNIISSN